jgi:hypothetical protein
MIGLDDSLLDRVASMMEMTGTAVSSAGGSEETIVCRAEVADCTCPDDCERDHGND